MTFEQFCEEIPDGEKPHLDRRLAPVISWEQRHFQKYGYVILRDFIPDNLIDAYTARYQRDNGENARLGYNDTGTPYRPDMQPALLYESGESKGYFFPF